MLDAGLGRFLNTFRACDVLFEYINEPGTREIKGSVTYAYENAHITSVVGFKAPWFSYSIRK